MSREKINEAKLEMAEELTLNNISTVYDEIITTLNGHSSVVLNFKKLMHIDSSAIQFLVSILKSKKYAGKNIEFYGPVHPNVNQKLSLMGLSLTSNRLNWSDIQEYMGEHL